jgi:septal ring factor EnvC (AmiA/AmiB activator)
MSPFPGTPQLPEVTGKPLRDNAFPSRRHHIAAYAAGAGCCWGWLWRWPALPGAAQTTRETERKLQKLRTELKGVAQERRQIEGQRGQASQQLREADEKVARTGRALAQTEAALREQAGPGPGRAAPQQPANQPGPAARELAGLLRAAYQLGNHAPLKLLLSQDTVADANRALAYHRYLQRERAQRITTLTADLKELEALQAQIAERKQKLQGAAGPEAAGSGAGGRPP